MVETLWNSGKSCRQNNPIVGRKRTILIFKINKLSDVNKDYFEKSIVPGRDYLSRF